MKFYAYLVMVFTVALILLINVVGSMCRDTLSSYERPMGYVVEVAK